MTMATRFELISALYDDVSKDVIRSPSNWQEFLKSSCNNYGLPFSEQLLVYAQKPDAVAVLPMASWNRKFGRWVNKGAKGIALLMYQIKIIQGLNMCLMSAIPTRASRQKKSLFGI